MQLASSASQRPKVGLATMAAAQMAVGHYKREDVIRIARLAKEALELRLTVGTVVMELSVCHAGDRQGRAIVFPSNAHLERKCGVGERAIRDALSKLVDERLIARRDSANQKRFSQDGESFGFDLTPMLLREDEFARIIAERAAARRERKRLLAVIGSERRQARICIEWLAQHSTANTDTLAERFARLAKSTPRPTSKADVGAGLVDDWTSLRNDAQELLAKTDAAEFALVETSAPIEVRASESAANAGTICRHIEPVSNLSIEDCNVQEAPSASQPPKPSDDEIDLKLVLEACPAVEAYGQPIRSAHDLVAAAHYLRPSTGASGEVWSEGVATIGVGMTAVATIFALQRLDDDASSGANRITNPGGLLRSILRGIATGKVSLKLDLIKLRRRRIQ